STGWTWPSSVLMALRVGMLPRLGRGTVRPGVLAPLRAPGALIAVLARPALYGARPALYGARRLPALRAGEGPAGDGWQGPVRCLVGIPGNSPCGGAALLIARFAEP